MTSSFLLKRIDFTKSELLSEETLRGLAATVEGREVTLAEVVEVVERINTLYRERGIPTAQAVLPAQEVADGNVTIKLVEGRVGDILLEGNASTADSFILSRIGQTKGELADVGALERSMMRFNRTQDVQLRAELKPGAKFGDQSTRPPRLRARESVALLVVGRHQEQCACPSGQLPSGL